MPRVIEYIVVVEPIPSASASDATAAMPGERRIMRRPSRREDILGTGNRERGTGKTSSGCCSTREQHPEVSQFVRYPLPATRYPRYRICLLLREVVQRQPAKAVVGRPVAAQGVDVAAQGAVPLVLREVQVVDPDLADDVAVLRDLEALDAPPCRPWRRGRGCGRTGRAAGRRSAPPPRPVRARRGRLPACDPASARAASTSRLPGAPLDDRHRRSTARSAVAVTRSWYASLSTVARWLKPTVADIVAPKPLLSFASVTRRFACTRCSSMFVVRLWLRQRLLDRERRVDLGQRDVRRRHDVDRRVRRQAEQPLERRVGALEVELRAVERRARLQQRELALQEVVLADLADLEPPLVQVEQRVVDGDLRRGVVQRESRGEEVEERGGRVDRDVLACLEVLTVGRRSRGGPARASPS